LIEQLKEQNSTLTQELVDLAQLSWEKYLVSKVLKNVAKSELAAQPSHISAQWNYVQARALDPSWADAAQAKDEKFTMHMNTLV
jgi:hypothetical protein